MPAVASRQALLAKLVIVIGLALLAMFLQTVLSDPALASQWFSTETWAEVAGWFGGRVDVPSGEVRHGAEYLPLAGGLAAFTLVVLTVGALVVSPGGWSGFQTVVNDWGLTGWAWWCLPGAWELVRVVGVLAESTWLEELAIRTVSLVAALSLSGWLSAWLSVAWPGPGSSITDDVAVCESDLSRRSWVVAVLAVLAYTTVATSINWARYHNLLIPHGDSAMYEEHLWNTWSGKGFRSFLDDGRLFLGEHPQVVHLLLSPLYGLWPTHLLLELCESLALALGSLAVLRMVHRRTGSELISVVIAISYLVAFPIHFLDIAIDGKTFRPIALGVPLLVWGIERWESGRWKTAIVLLLLSWTAKEDFCLVTAPLGAYWALESWRGRGGAGSGEDAAPTGASLVVMLGSIAWLGLVLLLIIPAFRGDAPHYAQYFGELGGTPEEIVSTSLRRPDLLMAKWFSPRSLFYAVALLMPLGFLPLVSRARLLVAAPIFAMLCLLEFSSGEAPGQPVVPFHHFHAPLVPILYWAVAAGLGRLVQRCPAKAMAGAWMALASSLACGLFFSAGPLGLAFWDAHSDHHGGTLFEPSRRALMFREVENLVPTTGRVFSTDFVHPRFTHHARSYDYSGYKRHSDIELTQPVPGEDYYIVIDVQHPYSTIRSTDDVPELKQENGGWKVLRLVTDTDGTLYYIVLRRLPVSPDAKMPPTDSRSSSS